MELKKLSKTRTKQKRSLKTPPHHAAQQLTSEQDSSPFKEKLNYIDHPDFPNMTLTKINKQLKTTPLYRNESDSAQTKTKPESAGYIHSLYQIFLLSAEGERLLFLKLNFLKYLTNHLIDQLPPNSLNKTATAKINNYLREIRLVRNQLIESNLRLVVSLARKFCNDHLSFEELVSEGNMILINAVDKFDFSKGFRFSTYATHAVQRHYYRLFQRSQRKKNVETSASSDLIKDISVMADESEIDAEELKKVDSLISEMDQCLDAREQFILRERFGFNLSCTVRSLQSLADELGICKERVRQLHHQAIHKLRLLADQMNFTWLLAYER